jgi:hypothetical protein
MTGIQPVLLLSPDFQAVHVSAKCMVEGCVNGAWSVYKRAADGRVEYVSVCNVLPGHEAADDFDWCGWTSLFPGSKPLEK